MDLKQIIEKINQVNVFEKRRITDEYVELVFYSEETDKDCLSIQ